MAKLYFNLLGAITLLALAARASAQHGSFRFCCELQKCTQVVAACAESLLCAASCLGANTTTFPATCAPAWSLPGQDYSCFAQYLSPDTSLIGQVCGQSYSPSLPPAPNAFISFGECRTMCGGWDLTTASVSTGPIAMLMQYIVPVVVFCFTIPRRRKWEVPDWMFEPGQRGLLRPPRLVLSLLLAGLIVTVDMIIWIFTAFITAGPILVGGITELVLDFEILRHMEDSATGRNCPERAVCLTPNERIELMAVVLCGNLDHSIGDPQKRIRKVLRVEDVKGSQRRVLGSQRRVKGSKKRVKRSQRRVKGSQRRAKGSQRRVKSTQAHLSSMLRSQGTFGSMVGAPVLFFVGSFALTLDSLSENIGDNSSAINLAFGMWWALLIPLTVVASCVLGSNNPSTVSGIVGEYKKEKEHSSILRWLKTLGMSPMYQSVFMPVTLWNRGRMKKRWLQHTTAWETRCWLRKRLEIRPFTGLLLVPLSAFLLVLIPTALAFLVSYTTPKICVSCKSMTFLVYISSQLVLVVANAWRTYYSSLESASPTAHPVVKAIIVLLTSLAVSGSLFTAFTGTILQLLGVYSNCICSIPAGTWLSPGRDMVQINLATDTLLHRKMSVYWSAAGYTAIGVEMTMTYLGWWYQRALRRRFEGEINRLNVE